MDKDIVKELAYKVQDKANHIKSSSINIARACSGTSKDPLIEEHNNKIITESVYHIRTEVYKINEYIEEIHSHIFDGKINGE